MNAETKARWLARLRDGSRRQGRNRLETIEEDGASSFCCLGVLCELAVEDGVIARSLDEVTGIVKYDGDANYPTPRVTAWAGLPDSWAVVGRPRGTAAPDG